MDVIFVRAFVALELLAGSFHAAETSNTLGCVCCCPACWKCLTQQQTGLCFVVPALIHPFSGELAEVSFCWSQLHQVMLPLRFLGVGDPGTDLAFLCLGNNGGGYGSHQLEQPRTAARALCHVLVSWE